MIGVGVSLRASLAAGKFSPRALFALSEPGVWYDPSDLTTMFQDRAGTTLVTTPGQSVGLVLDKRLGLTPGPELVSDTTLDNPAAWTVSGAWVVSGGAVSGTSTGSGTTILNNAAAAAATANRSYEIRFTIVSISAGAVGAVSAGSGFNVAGTYRQIVHNSDIRLRAYGTTTATIDNISVREIPGNHMVATADASRGTYGIEPFGGRRNLLTFTEQFDNAAWVVGPSGVATITKSTTNAAAAPDGTMTADRVIFNLNGGTTTGDIALLRQSATVPAGSATHSVYLRSFDGVSSYVMQIIGADGLGVNITVTPIWQRFSVTATSPGTATNYGIRLRGGQSPANSDTADILIWGAQLELGSTATNYQRVTTAFDVTEAGVPTVHYVQFDGADDRYVTSTITPGTDKVQVFAGVRKLSDAASGHVISNEPTTGASSSFALLAPSALGANSYRLVSAGTAVALAGTGVFAAAPDTAVIVGLADIAGDFASLRRNGLVIDTDTSNQGSGNYANRPISIGSRASTDLPFNGRLYQMVVRFGPNLDAARIEQVERFIAQRTGVTL